MKKLIQINENNIVQILVSNESRQPLMQLEFDTADHASLAHRFINHTIDSIEGDTQEVKFTVSVNNKQLELSGDFAQAVPIILSRGIINENIKLKILKSLEAETIIDRNPKINTIEEKAVELPPQVMMMSSVLVSQMQAAFVFLQTPLERELCREQVLKWLSTYKGEKDDASSKQNKDKSKQSDVTAVRLGSFFSS